ERRWRAAAALMQSTIPAIVRTSDDRRTLELAMVENLQRQDLNPLEEAAGLAHLIEEYGLTQDDLARRLGKSRPGVANTLRLLALPDSIKAMLMDGRLSAGHGRALLGAPPEARMPLAQRTAREGLNVRQLERLAGATTAKRRRSVPQGDALSAEERDFEARLREKFATAVTLVRTARGGRIELRFANDAELMRIGDLLLGE
ncbi:MAG: ParB/RepB/Spo0J family partition protein, partial [Candidatus Eremiobacteraeota bacterium]|nr:ParB/RepB/Spo0J family partition protein [Candidatus Eremiobacteraeota bacterium]